MKRFLTSLFLAGSLAAAQSQGLIFIADMSGAQVEPPVPTDAFGIANIEFNEAIGELDYGIIYVDLPSVPQGVFLFIGAPGVNGTPILDLSSDELLPGLTTGFVEGVGTLTNPGDIAAFLAGNTYVQILGVGGTPMIRGQVLFVPEPATATLAGLAALSLLAWRRRGPAA